MSDPELAHVSGELKVLVESLKIEFTGKQLAPISSHLSLPAVDKDKVSAAMKQFITHSEENFSEWSRYLFWFASPFLSNITPVSYTHLTLPTTPYV